ncbi:MAG: DUF2284 domain-containing protein [Bacillota bacterium]|nr:DUF2284 domain-containing protein [Bacillota bacterium]
MYTTERYEATIPVKDYFARYVNIEEFVKRCRECSSYENTWSCPPFDFDVPEYWQSHELLELTAIKIIFDDVYRGKTYSDDVIKEITDNSIFKEKQRLSEELFAREKEHPGSVSLSAGSCSLCKGGCGRAVGRPCVFPEKMRYSIESLGGNVGLTISELMGIELEWMEENKLPAHFVLVCGLLI